MKFLSSAWGDLHWTSWIPFATPSYFKHLPALPGVYRIRAVGVAELFYLGETGRSLRERLGDLRRHTMKETMPYNDPHTAAPSLWAWRHAENIGFECSVAPVTLADEKEEARKLREGLEFYLLWLYRLEFGSSTRCNHGRFHPRYKKSTDRKKGVPGYRLPDEASNNPNGGPSLAPLQLVAEPFDLNWMGLAWSSSLPLEDSNLVNVPNASGVYRIFDPNAGALLYIGESNYLRKRLTSHAMKDWECITPLFSYVQLPYDVAAYQRREIENDLVGGYYSLTKNTPKFQLINHNYAG